MTIRVSTAAFTRELEWVSRFIEKKTTIPILANVALQSANGIVTMTGTDLEIGGTTQVDCSSEGLFGISVPSRRLLKYLALVEEPELQLSVDGFKLTIRHGVDSEVILDGMSLESFPQLPATKYEGVLSGLRLAVPRALIAVSVEESRFALNGALIDINTEGSRMVATDGHRLSLCDLAATDLTPQRVMIPRAAMAELIATGEDAFHFGTDENHVFFLSQSSMRRIMARKLTGKFPYYERVIPKEMPNHCQMSSTALWKAVERVILFADERSQACTFGITTGVMEVSSDVIEVCEATNRIPATWVGKPFLVGLNGRYVQQFLKAIPPNGDFEFSFDQPWMACKCSVPGWVYLLMPLRI